MIQIAYHSSTQGLLSPDNIKALLVGSRVRNARRGITGMLLYKNGNVLQVMEGPTETALALFEVLKADPRHRGIIRLYEKPILKRDFPDWKMGFHNLDADSSIPLDGFTDIFGPDFIMSSLNASAAAKLIGIFKKQMS